MIKGYCQHLQSKLESIKEDNKNTFAEVLAYLALPYDSDMDEQNNTFSEKELQLVQHMIWYNFGEPDIKDFGGKYVKEVETAWINS